VDVLVLIDKLDELVQNAKGVPLSQDQVRVDREEIWEIIDQMRSTIPEEIKQAHWIVKERQEMLAEAKREAERLISEARRHERTVRLGAEDYADSILENLHTNLGKIMVALERGREQLAARSDERTSPATAEQQDSGAPL
jgi:hypothetical protein